MPGFSFADLASNPPPIAPPDGPITTASTFPYHAVFLGLLIAAMAGFALWGLAKLRARQRERRRARSRRVIRQYPLG